MSALSVLSLEQARKSSGKKGVIGLLKANTIEHLCAGERERGFSFLTVRVHFYMVVFVWSSGGVCVSDQLKNGNFLSCEACVNNCISD